MMIGHFWLTDEYMERLQLFFPEFRGKSWVDDRRVLTLVGHGCVHPDLRRARRAGGPR